MKALITGAAGMLGGAMAPALRHAGYAVVETDVVSVDPGIRFLDVRDKDAVREIISAEEPDLVLHLAAETDVEACEADADHARKTNYEGTRNVILGCREDTTLVYISTAGVFDGKKEEPYTEDDAPGPLMEYGRWKLAGEEVVLERPRSYVIRAGWMVGGKTRDKKFVRKVLRQVADGRDTIYAVDDRLGTPTYTTDFSRNLLQLLETDRFGLYHMACRGTGSRLDVARHIVKTIGREDVNVVPVNSAFFADEYPAPRPRSEMLVNHKLDLMGLNLMRDWRRALADYLLEGMEDWIADQVVRRA